MHKHSVYHGSSKPLARAINTLCMYVYIDGELALLCTQLLITLEEVELRN